MTRQKEAVTQACNNAIHRDPNGAGSQATMLARIVALEGEAGIESPELEEAKAIHEKWEAEAKAEADKAAAKK